MLRRTKRITSVILSILLLIMAGLLRIALGEPEPAPALLQQQPIQPMKHCDGQVQAELDQQKGPHTKTLQQKLLHPEQPADVLVIGQFLFKHPPNPEVSKIIEERRGFADADNALDFYLQGLSHKMLGDYDAALAAHLKAVELLETDRHQLRDERSRGTFSESTIHFYYAAIRHLLDRHRFAEAFAKLEQSRSRAMADMLASQTPELSVPEKRALFAGWQQSKAEIALGQQELFALRSQAVPNQQAIDDLEKDLQKREEAYQQLLRRIAQDAPRLLELGESELVSLQQLQQSMQEERYEVLSYLALEDMTILWHISGDAIHVRAIFLPRSLLIDKVAQLRKSINGKKARFDQQTAQELFLFLIQPALHWITSNHLVILPHEALYGVPFQVFQDPSDCRYLGERFQLSYAPSATILLRLKQMGTLAEGGLLAIETTGLSAAQEEVEAIANLYPNTQKVGKDRLITKADLLKALAGNYDLLHVSMHGVFDAAAPLLSYLKLIEGGQDDVRLTAAEMFGLPLTKTRLVVLSACEIGRVEATHANEILGMVRALLYAGANSLILSSWEVDAASTALWMKTFYQEAQTKPVREAARLALVAVKNDPRYTHPFYWAPFVMIGK